MMLFGGAWDPDTDSEAPRLNFNTIGAALVTVYDCLTGEEPIALPRSLASVLFRQPFLPLHRSYSAGVHWSTMLSRVSVNCAPAPSLLAMPAPAGTLDLTMFYAMSVTSGAAALYYICLTVIGGFLVLNLLVAILYELFKNEVEGKAAEGGEGPLMRKVRCWPASAWSYCVALLQWLRVAW